MQSIMQSDFVTKSIIFTNINPLHIKAPNEGGIERAEGGLHKRRDRQSGMRWILVKIIDLAPALYLLVLLASDDEISFYRPSAQLRGDVGHE